MSQQIVVGVYQFEQNAQKALDELKSAGFSRERISIDNQAEQSAWRVDSSGRLVRSDHYEPSSKDKDESAMSEFFSALAGSEDEEKQNRTQAYAHAISQGHTLLQVTCDSDDQADQAMQIMNHYDPIGLDAYDFSFNNPMVRSTPDIPSYLRHGAVTREGRSMGRQDKGPV